MMLARLSISVIICAYTQERWDDLCEAVAAAEAQTYQPLEILVVIDHHPELWRRVRRQLPTVTALENTGARGLSGARNTGIARARGEILAFVDEDAVPARDWLEQLATGYDATGHVLGVGGAIEPWWLAGRPAWFPEEFDWVVGCTYRGMPVTSAQVRNLIGCNMSFRRGVLTALGGFRNGIGRIGSHPVGCEETELCIRARQRWPQGRLVYRPQARVAHRVPPQRGTGRYFFSRCFFEGRSKALVSRLAGSQMGLASERTYATRALPRAAWRNVLETIRSGRPAGLMRSAVVGAGLAVTVAGFVTGRLGGAEAGADIPHSSRTLGTEEPRVLEGDVPEG